jgi:hypothetical protein
MARVLNMQKSPFASSSLALHLGRGAIGLSLFSVALHLATSAPTFSVLLGIGALAVLRGCPVCWLLGLIETIHSMWKMGHCSSLDPTAPKL